MKIASFNDSLRRLFVAVSFLNLGVDAAFWKYIVAIQAISADEAACVPPIPSVTIQAGTAPITISAVEEASCVPAASGVGIVCTGPGSVIFYVQQLDPNDAGELTIEMSPQQVSPFSCTSGLPVAQGYTLGQLCPDGSADMMRVLNCSPPEAFRFTGLRPSALGSVICVTDCDGSVCTQDDFSEFVKTDVVHSGCSWETAAATPVSPTPPVASPVMTPLPVTPTRAPVSPTVAPITSASPEICGGYLTSCSVDSDCCSERCVFQECQKAIIEVREKLSSDRGGAGGGTIDVEEGTRKLIGSVRGAME